MRQLTTHAVNPVTEKLTITVLDAPSHGGASHDYEVTTASADDPKLSQLLGVIRFQTGPISEAGVNGVTHEALLAIVIDRLRCFQEGAFRCRENAIALTKLEEAMHWLHDRTRARMARNVEGTSKV